MRIFLSILFVFVLTISASAQKVAKVDFTTTASIVEVLEDCKSAGKEHKYGSKDFDPEDGTLTLWRLYAGNEVQINIRAQTDGELTKVYFRAPRVASVADSYIKPIRKIIENLSLPDLKVGEYVEEIE